MFGFRILPRSLKRNRSRRGATLIETAISSVAVTTVAAFVVAVSVATAKQTNSSIATLPSETSSYRGMDKIRQEVMSARANSMKISEDGRSVEFRDAGEKQTSRLFYHPGTKRLLYDRDTSTNNDELLNLGEYEDVEFDTKKYGRYISVQVQKSGKNAKNNPITLKRQEWLRVRN